MLKIQFNGSSQDVEEHTSIAAFLDARNILRKNLILEWNGTILSSSEPLENHILQDGDLLNLFSVVAGG